MRQAETESKPIKVCSHNEQNLKSQKGHLRIEAQDSPSNNSHKHMNLHFSAHFY